MIFKNYLNKDVLKNIFVLSIITSGLKIFGYAYSFIIFLPFIFFYRKILLREIDRNKFSNKLVMLVPEKVTPVSAKSGILSLL